MQRSKNSERGQALILITLAMVALLGLTAVAVEGSMAYSDRRYAQSSADTASLAGATKAAGIIESAKITTGSWSCMNGTVQSAITQARAAAIQGATANGMTVDANLADHNGVQVDCVDTATEKYLDIRVDMVMRTETGLSRVVYQGPIENRVTATSRVRPRNSLALGYTIVALNPDGCTGNQNGAMFHGNPDVLVRGGGIFTNGCLRGKGSINVTVQGPNGETVTDGIYYVKEKVDCGNCKPKPVQTPNKLKWADFDPGFTPEELCKRPGAVKIAASNLPETLSPGLYCITGGLKFSGNKKGKLYGNGVTLVFLSGGLDCSGNCELNLKAPTLTSNAYPAVPGLLIYSTASYSWKLNGNNNTYFQGSILAPNADISLLGTGNEDSFKTQVICWNFEGGGNNASTYKWFDDLLFSDPVELELNR